MFTVVAISITTIPRKFYSPLAGGCAYTLQLIYSGRDAASRFQERCMNVVLAQWNSELCRDSFLRMRFLFASTALLSTRGIELLGFDVLAVPFPVGIATLA